jgi:hypothetical protein
MNPAEVVIGEVQVDDFTALASLLNLKSNLECDLKLSDLPLHNAAALIDDFKPVHVANSLGRFRDR